MLFDAGSWPGLADGSITVTFRPWKRPQARVGGRYRVGGLLLEAMSLTEVSPVTITDADATSAGAVDREALIDRFGQPMPDTVWRVDLRYVGPDDRIARRNDDGLDADQLAAVRATLERLDRGSPWTRSTMLLIERYPGVVSTALARHAGKERPAFKIDVRKLKELGLTESLDVGYRLSPRGQAVLRALG